MRRLALFLTALILVSALASCSDDSDSGGSEGDDTTTTEAAAGPGADGSEFDDIAAMRDELVGAGIDCELDYEGLADEQREVSQCAIEGEQATISIWFDDTLRDDIVEEMSSTPGTAAAVGGNWTVEVSTPEVAQQVADALGGESIGS